VKCEINHPHYRYIYNCARKIQDEAIGACR